MARTPRSSAGPDGDRPSATRTPPPTSVTHVKSSCKVCVKLHSHASSGLASVAKYENPPAQNPYNWTGPRGSASCGPARSDVMYDSVLNTGGPDHESKPWNNTDRSARSASPPCSAIGTAPYAPKPPAACTNCWN